MMFARFYRLRFVSCVSRFNKLWLTQEHRLIDLVNHLPLKFSERTRYCLEKKREGELELQHIFFLLNDLNIIEV